MRNDRKKMNWKGRKEGTWVAHLKWQYFTETVKYETWKLILRIVDVKH